MQTYHRPQPATKPLLVDCKLLLIALFIPHTEYADDCAYLPSTNFRALPLGNG